MSAILLSIHPRHVAKILSGEKRYEYRKVTGSRTVSKIIIYSARPVKLLVAEVEVVRTLAGHPREIWLQTRAHAGITERFFDKYYEGRSLAIAYELGAVTRYEPARELSALGLMRGPQSFVYINEDKIK